jgi:hypothetical protein
MRGRLAVLGLVAAFAAAVAAVAGAAEDRPGFKTPQGSMLTPVAAGASVTPLITVGETLAGGYRFESIPDGIAIRERGQGRVDVFVNHETSRVPFPFTFPGAPTEANQNDFDNAQLSHLIVHRRTGGILHGSMAIDSSENYQRFCSNYLATTKEGFDRPILFTNEEGIDWVKREGDAFPATIGDPASRQIGVVVAHDVRTGKTTPIWGMGRHNHENSVAIPGFDDLVLLSGDDSFVSNPPQSQLYSYIAPTTNAVLRDEGDLWAFRSTSAGKDDYYDVGPGDVLTGEFVKVPKDVATGRNPDGSDLLAADKGYPPPPDDGTWQRNSFMPPPQKGVDGPQWVLEHWSDLNGVFQFIRIEDIAYDKRPGMENVVYLVDSGRGVAGAPGPGVSTNGRVWKMVLDENDPTKVTSLSILIDGDDRPVKDPDRIHQPDNIESTPRSLLITEDPGSSQQFNPGEPNATTARLWRYDLATGTLSVAARVDQSADEGPTDVDGEPGVVAPGRLGAWESSGVVDVSDAFGPGSFLVTVQAHTLWVEKALGDDVFPPPGADWTDKREGGQLVLLRLPGA